ncbi:hypothetical protein DL766_003995 [Monosporascus sp. MC13-8B]|uniref:Glycosyltransferase family 25 protein n=1 Tax=Monosporascus cannonballus TaxID=155416 RepID=A0ABY0GZX4_9PEZI|nr:hypothetical protein DL762_008271 [Monosporascus cannonballus]RYO95915.1 hypothetical protein DL763_003463 [Monosporascus cannonballus]RYP32320.1 hypothetical protein DL766_003995 [Monosporascus sp. MC13-8B]
MLASRQCYYALPLFDLNKHPYCQFPSSSWNFSSGTDLPLFIKGIPSSVGTIYSDVTAHNSQPGPTDIYRVTNDTLGFSKVFVVGLPERSDKRDAMALASALTGFHVEWVDGVNGEQISDKAARFGVDRERLWNTNLGSWRGHMTAAWRIMEENLESALIMEDDVDWDTRLESQLPMIAQGARELFPAPRPRPPPSPYGWGWDLLWLGHCGEVFPELLGENKGKPTDDPGIRYMSRKFAISDDSTVPDLDKVTGLIDFRIELPHTRRVMSSYGSLGPDEAGDRGLDTKCISVTPPIFFHHKATTKPKAL